MILTVTLNAALDITYRVDDLRWAETNRVRAVVERPGGKGVNVARVLHALGVPTLATGFAGGSVGDALRHGLDVLGIPHDLVALDRESRRTVAVVPSTGEHPTLFNEPGPHVDDRHWEAFLEHFSGLLARSSAVVLSGSLPPGVPTDSYARLSRRARGAGVPVVLDADGPALLAGAAGGPTVVKPNAHELLSTTGLGGARGAGALRARGAQAVVVSDGANGMAAYTPEGSWRAALPAPLTGNPTGAGDAAVAALAAGLVDARPWPARLADAVALSAAAVLSPVAGEVDPDTYRRHLAQVRVEPLVPEETGAAHHHG